MRESSASQKIKTAAKLLPVLLIIIALCGAVFFFVVLPPDCLVKGPRASGGVIDLRNADFAAAAYSLDGEWEFYRGALYSPSDFAGGQARDGGMLEVPDTWRQFGDAHSGYATYRLTLWVDSGERLYMHIPLIGSSARGWVNGREVYTAGRVGTSEADTIVSLRNGIVPLDTANGKAEIVIQSANYEWPYSGLRFSLWAGRRETISSAFTGRLTWIAAVLGGILLIGVYHLFLYLLNRKGKEYVLFFLICLAISARYSLDAGSVLQTLIPGGLSITLSRVYCTLLTVHPALISLFSIGVFRLRPSRKTWLLFAALTLPAALWPWFFSTVNIIPFLFLYLIYLPAILVTALRSPNKKSGDFLYLCALFIFMFWSPFANLTWRDSLYVPGILPNLFLVLVQCVILSSDYANTHRKAEELAKNNRFLDALARMKTEYLANISHEMKTPLTVISVHVQRAKTLSEIGGSGEKIRDSLTRAQEMTMRVAKMADSALRLASMQESRERMETLDIAALLTGCAESHRIFLEKRGNTLTLDIPHNLPGVYGNADHLAQVLANLLSNANTHTDGGEISVRAEDKGDRIEITVRDNGTGVTPRLRAHVFERGVSDGGTGLGLSICKAVVESHGGGIDLQSGPGEGTLVTFTLPKRAEGGEKIEFDSAGRG